jgi:hypothetical protein
MSHYSFVAGYITYPGANGNTAAMQKNLEHVQLCIDTLPDVDSFPFLSKGMFSVTPETQIYRDGVVHFATSMKDVCSFWSEWEEKFERLLRQFGNRWYEARVFVWDEQMGHFILEWQKNLDGVAPWNKTQLYVQETVPGWLGKE